MSKEQVVIDAKAALLAGQDQLMSDVLGQVYDKAQSEASPGGPSEGEIQARIAQAVSEALAADEVVDQAKIDELNAMISGLGEQIKAMQEQYDSLSAKEAVEKEQLENLKKSKDQLQSVVDYLGSLFQEPPAA